MFLRHPKPAEQSMDCNRKVPLGSFTRYLIRGSVIPSSGVVIECDIFRSSSISMLSAPINRPPLLAHFLLHVLYHNFVSTAPTSRMPSASASALAGQVTAPLAFVPHSVDPDQFSRLERTVVVPPTPVIGPQFLLQQKIHSCLQLCRSVYSTILKPKKVEMIPMRRVQLYD